MYRSFRIKNFRGFDALELTDLKRINLIGGLNNVGKTSLLEALFIHSGGYNPELGLRVNVLRGLEQYKVGSWDQETPVDSLFRDFDTTQTVSFEGEDDTSGRRMLYLAMIRDPQELTKLSQFLQTGDPNMLTEARSASAAPTTSKVLRLETNDEKQSSLYLILDKTPIVVPAPPQPPFPTRYLTPRTLAGREDVDRFSKLEKRGDENILLKVLQIVEPGLRRLALIQEGGATLIHGDVGLESRRFLPLFLMGAGMTRLASLVLAISDAPGGVVLIDEVENGLHHSILQKVWQAIGEAAVQFNTQVFATTHSWECIVAAHKAFSENGYDFGYHRLERTKKGLRAVTYSQETLEAAIEIPLEVR